MTLGIDVGALAAGVARADRTAVAQALNLVEDSRVALRGDVVALLAALAPVAAARFHQRVGLTGPPGVGKSTLTAALAREWRNRGKTVGILAVDPSSKRTGGAMLGDRARMGFEGADSGVFVRSLASKGQTGGLTVTAHGAIRVLEAAYDVVVVETTGVGQTETEVEHAVDTVVLVVQPGAGDTLQFIKAGILEIPDIIVVNKADEAKLAERAVADVSHALHAERQARRGAAELAVLATSATLGTGVGALVDAITAHGAHGTDEERNLRRLRGDTAWVLHELLRLHGDHGLTTLGGEQALRARITALIADGAVPLAAVETLSAAYVAG